MNQHGSPLSPTGLFFSFEETSLHRRIRSNSKDRNWGIFSLRHSDYNARGCDTDVWCLCEAGRFSYDELPQTPPLSGNFTPPTILERGETLGDPKPVYALPLPEAVTHIFGIFVKQVVFLTVNRRGPSP